MRLMGTGMVCVLAAFGAAFLVAHASGHQDPARPGSSRAGTASVRRTASTVDLKLASQFTPQLTALARPVRHRRHANHKRSHHAPRVVNVSTSATQSGPLTVSPSSQGSASAGGSTPSYTPSTPVEPAPSGSGGGSGSNPAPHPSHQSQGTGTTTIG